MYRDSKEKRQQAAALQSGGFAAAKAVAEVLLALCVIKGAALAQTVEVRRAGTPIRVDGVLDESAWAEATAIELPWEYAPRDNAPAPVATQAFITWDAENLYVAFRAQDPEPTRIRSRYHERDTAGDDDLVGFYVDPFNDDRRAYQFRVNPLGVQMDALNDDVEDSEDFTWDGIWESAGQLTADGFTVEVMVPLQQLRVPERSGPQTWGFLAMRQWPRDVEHGIRSIRTDQNRDCLVCQFADIRGIETSTAGHDLELTPTLTAIDRDDENGSDQEVEPGVSARWGITTGTSLQVTLNPDFSQVEADAAQLDVNTRFALFFPEKRPFFIEGADFFETHLPLAFTRTIADPIAGLKLTGKSGDQSYGLLIARDEVTNLLIPGDESSFFTAIAGESTDLIGRYRHDFGKATTVGGFLSSRTGVDYENLVLSADSYHRVTESDSLRFQAAASRTSYPDFIITNFDQPSGTLSGHALQAGYNHSGDTWSWAAGYLELSPELRTDAGFINQVGIRAADGNIVRRIRGNGRRWFSDIYLVFALDTTQEYDGEWTEWGSDMQFIYEGPRQSYLSVNFAPNQEYFAGTTYHNFRTNIVGEFQLSRDIELELEMSVGEAIDFTNARQADFITMVPEIDFNIGRHIGGELLYARETFETTSGQRIFTVDLPQLRVLYHLNRQAFVRVIAQYEIVDRNQAAYILPVEARSEELLTQVLFSYRLNAQTVFLAGYSDFAEGSDTVDLRQQNRTVIAKLSYAWLW